MKHVISETDLLECYCDEAINLPTDIVYDSVLSNGVFHYFPDVKYAENVLEKMLKKARQSIGILDIHDIEKKEAFMEYRINNTPDYKERYKDLPKLFYRKEFFQEFANKHNLKIVFEKSTVEGYWNNEFIFNCFMYV